MSLVARYADLVEESVINEDPAQRHIAVALDQVISDCAAIRPRLFSFRKKPQPKGLYIWGGVGRGKTMMMDLAMVEMKARGIAARRFHFHEFMARVHDRVVQPDLVRHADPARQVAAAIADGAQVLCFDEMEVRDIADAMIVARVMEGFMEPGGVLIATSNRHPDDLYENGLHRERFLPFIALLKDALTLHEVVSPNDWRQRQFEEMRLWFQGPDDATLAAMQAAFIRLTSGIAAVPEILTVAGRKIDLPKVAGSVVFADFDDLCAQPLAARDYLALADRATGLLLHGIPQMGDNLQNEARRFMWLIDALYDRQRFLVGSSLVAMADLYQGRQWAAEFPRTLSRLQEMTGKFISGN